MNRKLEGFINIAEAVAAMSKDPSTKVGCLIIDDDWNILSTGWNGFPRGVDDLPDRLNNRDVKRSFTSHAERNAVAQAARNGVALKGGTAIITSLPPCSICAQVLIQAGIKQIYFPEPDVGVSPHWIEEWGISRQMLLEADVSYTMYRKD